MQTLQAEINEKKINLNSANRNYAQTFAYCTFATAAGLTLAATGVNFDNSFLRYAGDALETIGGVLSCITAGGIFIINHEAKREFSSLEGKTNPVLNPFLIRQEKAVV